jgi:hypothetical protein
LEMMDEMCPGIVGMAGAAAAAALGAGGQVSTQSQQQQQEAVSEGKTWQRQQQLRDDDGGVSESGSVHFSDGSVSVASSAYTTHSHHHQHHLSAHQSLKDMKDKISSLKAILLHEPRCDVCGRPLGSGAANQSQDAASAATVGSSSVAVPAVAAGTGRVGGAATAGWAGQNHLDEGGGEGGGGTGAITSPRGLDRFVAAKVQGKKLLEAITGALAVPLKQPGGEEGHHEVSHGDKERMSGDVTAAAAASSGGQARWYTGTAPHVTDGDGKVDLNLNVRRREQEVQEHGQRQQQLQLSGQGLGLHAEAAGGELRAAAHAPAGEAAAADAEFDAAAPGSFDGAAGAAGGDPSLGEKWRSMMVALKAAGHQLPSFSGSLLEGHLSGGGHEGTGGVDGQVSMVKQMWDSWAPKASSPTSQGGSSHFLHMPQVGALADKAPAIASLFRRPSKGLNLLPTNSTGGYQGSSAGASGHAVLGGGGAVSSSSIIVGASSNGGYHHQQQQQQEGVSPRRAGTRLGGLPPLGSGQVNSPPGGNRPVLSYQTGQQQHQHQQQQQILANPPYPGSPRSVAEAAAAARTGADAGGGVTGLCPSTPPQRGLASPFSTPLSSFRRMDAAALGAAVGVGEAGRV